MSYYVGLDVSMKETVICIVNEKGESVHRGRAATDPEKIAQHLAHTKFKIEKVGIESGSLSHWLIDQLKKLAVPAICIDARKMAAVLSIRVNKTDDNDAQGIAEAMRCGMYREVSQKSQIAVETGTLMQCRKTLVHQRVQLINSVRGFLKTYGMRLGSCGEKAFSTKVKSRLSEIFEVARTGIESLLNCYEKLCEEIKKLESKIEELAKEDDDIKRLMTVPGVGLITATTFKTEIDDPKRFNPSSETA